MENTTYTPTPETRKKLIESFITDMVQPEIDPMSIAQNMVMIAVENDFNGSITGEQNAGIVMFCLQFMGAMNDHMKERFGSQ